MAKRKDLTGQKINKLTVVGRAPNRNGCVMYYVKCDCGVEKTMYSMGLLNRKTKSCGCIVIDKPPTINIGQVFTDLTVIEYTRKANGGRHFFKVLCKCGNEKEVSEKDLLREHTKSCGCRKKKIGQDSFKDLTGQKFGKLLVLNPVGKNRAGGYIWAVKCDCGNFKEVTSGRLVCGTTRSCGCLRQECGDQISLSKTMYPAGYSGMNSLYKSYRNKAEKRKLVFELTIEQFQKLTQGNCNYCGDVPSKIIQRKDPHLSIKSSARTAYIYNGIDRVDNNIGYIFENCVPCCTPCNFAKHTLSLEEWNNWIKRFIEFQLKKSNQL